jgi:AbrB family looped-hinge helix DNA binding protein
METTIELTKTSSKGQIVLPKDIRTRLNIKKGTIFSLQAKGKVILLRRIDNLSLKEDLETLKHVKGAWDAIEHGRSHKASKEAFLKELTTW